MSEPAVPGRFATLSRTAPAGRHARPAPDRSVPSLAVTHGHSGRPLQMGPIPWATFVLLQLVVLCRIGSEVVPGGTRWMAVAAAGWLVAFAPWVLRSLGIYLAPRADGQPG